MKGYSRLSLGVIGGWGFGNINFELSPPLDPGGKTLRGCSIPGSKFNVTQVPLSGVGVFDYHHHDHHPLRIPTPVARVYDGTYIPPLTSTSHRRPERQRRAAASSPHDPLLSPAFDAGSDATVILMNLYSYCFYYHFLLLSLEQSFVYQFLASRGFEIIDFGVFR